jgi:hypothetical protein
VELDVGTEVDGGAWSSSWGSSVGNSLTGQLHTMLTPSPCWSIHSGGSPARWRRPRLARLVEATTASGSAMGAGNMVERDRGQRGGDRQCG